MDSAFNAPSVREAVREVIRRHASLQGRTTKSLAEELGVSERFLLRALQHDAIAFPWSVIDQLTQILHIKWSITGEKTNEAEEPDSLSEEVIFRDEAGREILRNKGGETTRVDPDVPRNE